MYDEKTMDPLDNVVACFRNIIIQMQSLNDQLSWISQKEKLSHLTPEGFPIKCELCKEIYKHDIVANASDLIRGNCGKCRGICNRDTFKIMKEASALTKEQIHKIEQERNNQEDLKK